MINIVVGPKGSGKTGKLVDELNRLAGDDSINVVCIERGRRLDRSVKPQIRLVDISEYPVQNYRELLAFIAGISAKDFDLNELYIDSVNKVSNTASFADLATFMPDLESFSDAHGFNVTITLSANIEDLPEESKKYYKSWDL